MLTNVTQNTQVLTTLRVRQATNSLQYNAVRPLQNVQTPLTPNLILYRPYYPQQYSALLYSTHIYCTICQCSIIHLQVLDITTSHNNKLNLLNL